MLELIDIEKIYQRKRVKVEALRGITLTLPERGMVFIVGKSGSGKSTLLNLLGGLDKPTFGEFWIDGKCSKDYTAKDYDLYRNKYVGFIFQEYNLIENLDVGENIALALNLQGEKDKNLISQELARVGLSGYEKRKISTLSGGQKQRVSVARALIKDPKILIADEPTGALDSETGESLFELLKALSRERLVIVVSHDLEFAEKYGSRIIEMKDGKVISDKEKNEEFVSSYNEIKYKKTQKRGLGFFESLYLALKGTGKNPIRCALSVLLCACAFILLGISFLAAQYNMADTMAYSLEKYDPEVLLNKYEYCYTRQNIETLRKQYPSLEMGTIFAVDGSAKRARIQVNKEKRSAYSAVVSSGYLTEISTIDRNAYELVYGRLPEAKNEVAIPLCMYYAMAEYDGRNSGFSTDDLKSWEEIIVDDYDDIIGKYLYRPTLKIVGIVDTKVDTKFDVLKNYLEEEVMQMDLETDTTGIVKLYGLFGAYIKDSTFACGFVVDDFMPEKLTFVDSGENNESGLFFDYNSYGVPANIRFNYVADYKNLEENDKEYLYLKEKKESIAEDEIILPWKILDYVQPGIESAVKGEFYDQVFQHINDSVNELYKNPDFCKRFDTEHKEQWQVRNAYYDELIEPQGEYYYENPFGKTGYEMEMDIREIVFDEYDLSITLKYITGGEEKSCTKKIVGFFHQAPETIILYDSIDNKDYVVLSDKDILKQCEPRRTAMFEAITVNVKNNKDGATFGMTYNARDNLEDGLGAFYNIVASDVMEVDNHFHYFKMMGLVVGGAIAIVAILMMFNFISSNVKDRQKEIGILRALGMSTGGVCKIFALEALLLSIITAIIACVLSYFTMLQLNLIFVAEVVTPIEPLRFSGSFILLLLGVSTIVALLSALIPLIRIAKMQPVDAIRKN